MGYRDEKAVLRNVGSAGGNVARCMRSARYDVKYRFRSRQYESTRARAKVVTLADTALEVMLHSAMGKPEGNISVAETTAVTELDLSFQWRAYLPGVKSDTLKRFPKGVPILERKIASK